MGSATATFMLGCVAILLVLAVIRRAFARSGAGRLAQLEFRRRHGARVAELLEGRLDPQRGSPWIEIRVGGREARMVAAPIARGELQAGIELVGHELQVDVFHTTGELDELQVPAGVDTDGVVELVALLREQRVDNVARAHPEGRHVLRLRFGDVEELPARLAAIAALLERLERLGQAPKDWAQ